VPVRAGPASAAGQPPSALQRWDRRPTVYETPPSAPGQAKSLAGSRSLPRPPSRPSRLRRFRRRRRGLRRPSPVCLRPCRGLLEERRTVHPEGPGQRHHIPPLPSGPLVRPVARAPTVLETLWRQLIRDKARKA
jgi:hypothetical protein